LNLLKLKPNKSENFFNISDFREAQYKLIEYFVHLSIEYISKQNNNYLSVNHVNIQNQLTYNGIYFNEMMNVIVYTDNRCTNQTKQFFKFLIPSLIDKTFFVLNDNKFVPTLYLLDQPIVLKDKSIKLTSTFNSISIYDKLVKFMGINIPASYFLNLFLPDDNVEYFQLKKDIIKNFKISEISISDNDLFNYYANILKCDATREKIQEQFNNIFFDDYSKLLYKQYYNLEDNEINMSTILKITNQLRLNSSELDFIDLTQKRLVFVEVLLWPLFKRIAYTAVQASRGYYVDEILFDQFELVKNFYINLHNKFLYDNVNAFDTILQHKICMMNPNAEQSPGVIANLHKTHYKQICPTSISSQKPGETLYIVPEAELDIFGKFVKLEI
jgi:hypothetical protein